MRAAVRGVGNRLVRQAVKVGAALADPLVARVNGVVFLIYHSVGGPRPGQVNIATEIFGHQMAWLAANCEPLSIDEALTLLDNSEQPGIGGDARRGGRSGKEGRTPVVVTFDDGTADFVDNALPVLVAHSIPVTLYIATRWVDEQLSFWDDGTVLSWSALREAVSTGLVTPGSHTHSHVLLDRIDPTTVASELDLSIASISENLGIIPGHFAYPKALAPSAEAEAAVRARFRSAALAGSRANPFGATDPFRLARTPVQVADGLIWFRRKARGGLRLEDSLRTRMGAVRYAKATR